MIGKLQTVVLDCPDPHALAAFYGRPQDVHYGAHTGHWTAGWTALGQETAGSSPTPFCLESWVVRGIGGPRGQVVWGCR